jgi:hypothetical protein
MRTVVALLGLSALVGATVAGAQSLTVGQSGAPITSYPTAPRTKDGRDPHASVPRPVECSPARDRGLGSDYFSLSTLKRSRGDNPFVTGERSTVVLDLINVKQQKFKIYISAMSDAPVNAFIASTSACLEWFKLQRRVPTVIEAVRLDVLLVESAVAATGMSQANLSAARDTATVSGSPDALADVLVSLGIDPTSVITDAAGKAESALDAKVVAGELTAAEVAALDAFQLMQDLALQPQAPFLFHPNELPMTPGQHGALLKRDPRGAVLVGMAVVGPLSKGLRIVWYAFDPTLDAGDIHGYKAHCQPYSWTRLKRYAGSLTLKFWRVPTPNPIRTITADMANPYPPGVSHSSASNRTYDINVKSNADDSDYSVYGGWQQGTGGACG